MAKKNDRRYKTKPEFCRNGRVCTACQVYKTWTHFVIDKKSKYGMKSNCKECVAKTIKTEGSWYSNNIAHTPKVMKVSAELGKINPGDCIKGSMSHVSGGYPMFGQMPAECIGNPEKRKMWDEYVEYHTRWWNDVLRSEKSSSNKRGV